jgi:hypothetical protein
MFRSVLAQAMFTIASATIVVGTAPEERGDAVAYLVNVTVRPGAITSPTPKQRLDTGLTCATGWHKAAPMRSWSVR